MSFYPLLLWSIVLKIGILDADLLRRKNHRFPNLVCEKLSGFYKEQGAKVSLLTDFDHFKKFDHVFVSKVFTDTPVPEWLVETDKIHVGGTGFYFDKAPDLPNEIEHHMPDYRLYDEWIAGEVAKAAAEKERQGKEFNKSSFMVQFKEYTDYSIGFLTRGCFRRCKFCVNQKFNHVFAYSPLEEFYYDECKRICLLDDNFLGYPKWKPLLEQLLEMKKPFKFKQGLDERILTEEKCQLLFKANYDGDYTFAFDNIADYDLIESKLKMIRKYTDTTSIRFYVLVGFEGTDEKDIENAFERIKLLMKYHCIPYIMRFQHKNYSPWKESPYRSLYVTLARWANQPNIFKKMSFRQFCEANQELHKTEGTLCSSMNALVEFEKNHPKLAKRYFNMRYDRRGK